MLRWEKDINGYNGNWMGGYIGFDDDTYVYRVAEDENGWYYEHIMTQDGFDGYETAEEAMAAAEVDYAEYEADMRHLLELDDEPLNYEEAMEILGDMLYEERKEEGLF